jgi:probable F420-dependent oxidoreductase
VSALELGVILPNFGAGASADGVARVALAAEEHGFDSVWTTEHLLVGEEAAETYGNVLDPLGCLAWLAAKTERVALGTSIVILPLHHPVILAKQAATLQLLSGGRFRLGVGVGWHEDEFRFLGVGFEDRGARADESLRLIRALWDGDTSFYGDYWRFEDATFGPLPEPRPPIWVGGASRRAQRRAREHGDVWHPNAVDAEEIRALKETWPEGRIVLRLREFDAASLRDLASAGMDGAVLTFGSTVEEILPAMERFAREALPELA